MSFTVCRMNQYLEIDKIYKDIRQAASENNSTISRIRSLILHFPKAQNGTQNRFQYVDEIDYFETWLPHPWLPVYVSSKRTVDYNGKKVKKRKNRQGFRAGLDINGEWYFNDILFYDTFPLLK